MCYVGGLGTIWLSMAMCYTSLDLCMAVWSASDCVDNLVLSVLKGQLIACPCDEGQLLQVPATQMAAHL